MLKPHVNYAYMWHGEARLGKISVGVNYLPNRKCNETSIRVRNTSYPIEVDAL